MADDFNIIRSYTGGDYGRTATAGARPFKGIVIHVAGKPDLKSELDYSSHPDPNRPGYYGYHYLVDRDGKVYQTAPDNVRTNHIMPNSQYGLNNSNALGVSFIGGAPAGKDPLPLTPEQLSSGKLLVDHLRSQFNIPAGSIITHGQLDPETRGPGHHLGPDDAAEGADFLSAYNGGQPQPTQSTTAAPGTTINSTGAGSPTDNRQFLFSKLTGELGLQPKQALGVLYGLAGESGGSLDPKSYNPKDPGGSFGVANWLGPRRTALDTWARHMGTTSADPNAQWAYMKAELTGQPGAVNYSNVLTDLKQAGTTEDATRVWTGGYEQPKVNNWQQRLGQAPYVGTVDASGNFIPGSAGGQPSRPVTPTPTQAPGPADASIVAHGGTSPPIPTTPGTTINSTPAVAGATQGQWADVGKNLKTALGLPADDGKEQGQQDIKPSQVNFPQPQARNVSFLLGGPGGIGQGQVSPAYAQRMAALSQPMQWGAAPPGQMFGAGFGPQNQPVYGTSLMSNLQMLADPWQGGGGYG